MKRPARPCAQCLLFDVAFFLVPVRFWERYPGRAVFLFRHAHRHPLDTHIERP